MVVEVPGLAEAYDAERNIRLASYVPVAAEVYGVALPHLTLTHYSFLFMSPFVLGGNVSYEDALAALWVLTSPDPLNAEKRKNFVEVFAIEEDFPDLIPQLISYFSEVFFDAPTSKPGEADKPCMTFIDWMVYRFTVPPWNWSMERIMQTPIRQLFQLSKVNLAYHGSAIKNPISDNIAENFIRNLNSGR